MTLQLLAVVLTYTCAMHTARGSFLLTTSPSSVEIGVTTGFTLHCSYWGNSADSSIRNITSVQIQRETGTGNFEVLAERNDTGNSLVSSGLDPLCMVTGYVGDVMDTYLKMIWPVATVETVGNFHCQVSGLDGAQNTVTESSPIIAVQKVAINVSEVLSILKAETKRLKDHCDAQVAEVYSNLTSLLSNDAANINASSSCSCIDVNSSQIEDLRKEIAQQNAELQLLRGEVDQLQRNGTDLSSVKAEINALKDLLAQQGQVRTWPEGTYGLIMPENGCPENSRNIWETGFRKFFTASDGNTVDPKSNLRKPILVQTGNDNFLYLHFCVSPYLSGAGPWPRGSYCIHSVKTCPPGFNGGYVYLNGNKANPASTNNGTLPTINSGPDFSQIFYCCRSDGPANVAIYLPKADPFYLYRYKGTCQRVEGMIVQQEQVVMDTDYANREMFDFFDSDYHPDGSINSWSFELCYYH